MPEIKPYKKMTAVDILKEELMHVFVNDEGFHKLFEKVKEMEKQQIIDAVYEFACLDTANNYYNETYGSKGSDETKTK